MEKLKWNISLETENGDITTIFEGVDTDAAFETVYRTISKKDISYFIIGMSLVEGCCKWYLDCAESKPKSLIVVRCSR